jgi:hypothetical protein
MNPMASDAMGFFIGEEETVETEDNVIRELLGEITGLITAYPKALERRASIVQTSGKDPELVEKLVKAADTMRDSGNLYLTWAKHYAALAEGNSDASSDEDETEDFDV